VWANADLIPRPLLATSFAPVNNDLSHWRFTLRQGVKYNNGASFTSADVVSWMDTLLATGSVSNAATLTGSVLTKGNTKAVDPYTVDFMLERAVAQFPLFVSNYVPETGIPPQTYKVGTFTGGHRAVHAQAVRAVHREHAGAESKLLADRAPTSRRSVDS
jgi:ABC-type transport system substrate-binding protein